MCGFHMLRSPRHTDLQVPRVHRAAADSAGLVFGLQGWEKLPPNRQEHSCMRFFPILIPPRLRAPL